MAVAFSALSSIFMYLLGKKMFDERTGLAAAVLMQIIPLYSAYGVLFYNRLAVYIFLDIIALFVLESGRAARLDTGYSIQYTGYKIKKS